MKTILQNKTAAFLTILSFSLLSVFFLSCKKDMNKSDSPTIQEQLPDLVSKVSSSVSGFVTDQNDEAVIGASVKVGSTSIITDRYGYFEVKNVQVVKEAATVTVTYDGYFNAIKTYMATEGKAAFFRIKLLQKTIAGTIDAANGGSVSLSNGMNISFPAAAIKDALTDALYTGTVKVAAQYIDPASEELEKIMPGDLRGIDDAGAIKGLTSFGMMAVELTGDAGQLLQIAGGKRSTLTMPIPPATLSAAPATIPLWYFDESKGLWMQEGMATKTDNAYVGEVSHFSYWNSDIPNITASFDCTIVDNNGKPVPYVQVRISVVEPTTNLGYSYNVRHGYTDKYGFVSGGVPNNAELLLEVFNEASCAIPIYSRSFSASSGRVSLGTITLSSGATSTISGSVTDCNGNPVTNGYVFVNKNGVSYFYDLNETTFNFVLPYCHDNNSLKLYAIDLTTSQEGNAHYLQPTPGINSVGVLNACGTSVNQFVNYNVNGVNYYIEDNSVNDFEFREITDSTGDLYVTVIAKSFTSPGIPDLGLMFEAHNITNTQSPGTMVWVYSYQFGPQIPNSYPVLYTAHLYPPPQPIHITEFGNVGEYISGYFSGIGDGPATSAFTISCSFRIKRS